MLRPGMKSLVMGVVLVASLVTVSTEAKAFWGHHLYGGWGYGWDCGWGGCGGPSYAPACYGVAYRPCLTSCSPCLTGCDGYNSGSWYLGYRPGPVRRLLLGHYRWYWGENAVCADACCPTSSACANCTDCAPTTVVNPAPTMSPGVIMGPSTGPGPTPAQPPMMPPQPAPSPKPAPATMLPDSTYMDPNTSGLLTIVVPADATVTVNGMLTKSTGSRRQYVSYGLNPGYSYKYDIRAEVIREGKVVVETRSVVLNAGSRTSVAFGFNVKPSEELAAR